MLKMLVVDYLKVEVPGLGAFFVETRPASFSDDRSILYPPRRRVAFRRCGTVAVAGPLLEQVRLLPECRETQPEEVLGRCVKGLLGELAYSGRALLPGFGTLTQDGAGTVRFEMDSEADLFLDACLYEPLNTGAFRLSGGWISRWRNRR